MLSSRGPVFLGGAAPLFPTASRASATTDTLLGPPLNSAMEDRGAQDGGPAPGKAAAKNAKRRAKRRAAKNAAARATDETSAPSTPASGLSQRWGGAAGTDGKPPAGAASSVAEAVSGDQPVGPLVDIGANLAHKQLSGDLPGLLQRAASAGVKRIVVTGTSVKSSLAAVRCCTRAGPGGGALPPVGLTCTAGVHPHDAKSCNEATIPALRSLALEHPSVVCAIGECGLDYNRNFSAPEIQRKWFRAQVSLACELQKPLFLHERDAHEDFVGILRPFLEARHDPLAPQSGKLPPAVVHCFTGTPAEAARYVELGLLVGLTGTVCMERRGKRLRRLLREGVVPLDRLMLETDAPFMHPQSELKPRGKHQKCEPRHIALVAQSVAAALGMDPAEVCRVTTANAERFFALA